MLIPAMALKAEAAESVKSDHSGNILGNIQ
jgi:hypothetical protein